MMFMKVDLPEPDGPHDGDELALGDVDADAGERTHLGVAQAVDLLQPLRCGSAAVAHQNSRMRGAAVPAGCAA